MTKQTCTGLNIQFFTLAFKILLIFTGLVFTPLSLAKIHIEPYVGWGWTFTNSRPLIKKTLTATNDYINEGRHYSGLTTGMRLGYSSLGLAVGLDFTVGYWFSLYKEGFVPFRNQETITPILPGLFVSYKLPLLFRAYASLIPQASVRFSSQEEEVSRTCNKSRGAKLGVSYLSLPFLSVNFEYLPLYISGQDCQSWSHTGTVSANFIF